MRNEKFLMAGMFKLKGIEDERSQSKSITATRGNEWIPKKLNGFGIVEWAQ